MNESQNRESRSTVVACFLTRRSLASLDGLVYTDGCTLCVGSLHVAFWHQGTIYLVPLPDNSDDLVKWAQAYAALGDNGHMVVRGVQYDSSDVD